MGKCRRLGKRGKGKGSRGGGEGLEPSGGDATSLNTRDPSPGYSASNFGRRGLLLRFPRNLDCIISFTATCTIHSGTTLVFACNPYSAGFPFLTVLFPLLRKIALQEASPLPGFLSAGPSQFSYSLALGAESYLLSCSFKRHPLLPLRSRLLTRDDSNEFGMFMQIGSPCGPIGSGGAGTADQWGGGVGAHHVRSGLSIKGNIVSLYMGGRVGGSLASCAWSRPPPPAVPAAASSLCPRGDADGRRARRRSTRTGGAPRSLGQPGPQGQESEGPGRPGRAGPRVRSGGGGGTSDSSTSSSGSARLNREADGGGGGDSDSSLTARPPSCIERHVTEPSWGRGGAGPGLGPGGHPEPDPDGAAGRWRWRRRDSRG